MRDLLIQNSSPPGDDGPVSISPERVTYQEASSSDATWRIVAYLSCLVATSVALRCLAPQLMGSRRAALGRSSLSPFSRSRQNGAGSGSTADTSGLDLACCPRFLPLSWLGRSRRWRLEQLPCSATFGPRCDGRFTRVHAPSVARSRASSLSWSGDLASSTVGSIAIATVCGAVTLQVLDLSFAASDDLGAREQRRAGLPQNVAPGLPVFSDSLHRRRCSAGPCLRELSPWTALLFLFPALAAQRLFAMYQEQRRLASDLAVVNERLERANLSFASALVTTLDARDRYTAGHSAAVAIYARDIAGRMGFATETQQLAHLSGLLHDIGKIGVPPGVLEKNGPLTLQERRKMEEHSVIGERILANVEAYDEIATIVRHHHERLDGQGYPDGIKGDRIPLISRIICVADAYNAMTSDRPYRDAMPPRVARERLASGSRDAVRCGRCCRIRRDSRNGQRKLLARRTGGLRPRSPGAPGACTSHRSERRLARRGLRWEIPSQQRSLKPRSHTELSQHVMDVDLRRALGDHEATGDLCVG